MALTARQPLVLPRLPALVESQDSEQGGGGGRALHFRPLPPLAGSPARRRPRQAPAAREDVSPLTLPATERGIEAGTEITDLQLSQYYDAWGKPHARSFSLTFVAKQSPQLGRTFGTRAVVSRKLSEEGAEHRQTANSYFLSEEARQKDLKVWKQKTAELLDSIQDTQRYQVEDVQRRQLEVLYGEVPDFKQFFPTGVLHTEVLPVDVDASDELANQNEAQRSLDSFIDPFWHRGKMMNWRLTRGIALMIWQGASLWMQAAWGPGSHLGIDRPTFCRFLLDCGLVDQSKVPLFWAVSLFDDLARPMRLTTAERNAKLAVPARPVVSWWDLVSIMDTILQQLFDPNGRTSFARSLLPIAKMRLPPEVLEESGLTPTLAEEIIEGEAPMSFFRTGGGPEGKDASEEAARLAALRPDKAAASPQEMRRAEYMRERIVKSLLVEPEVLHVVLQHRETLQRLHACYADERGEMDFSMLLQFCVDFQLCPALVPSHLIHRAYECAQCFTLQPFEPGLAPPPRKPRKGLLQVGGRRARMGAKMLAPSPGPKDRCCSSTASSKPGTPVSRCSSSASTAASTAATSATSASAAPASEPAAAASPELPWALVARAAQQAAQQADSSGKQQEQQQSLRCCSVVFGLGAFVEALCFIAFTYLGHYGNMQQKGMSGFARIVWLMTYLGSMASHLQQGLKRREGEEPTMPQGPLMDVLGCLPRGEDLWAGAPRPADLQLSPTVFRPNLKPDVRTAAKRRRPKNGIAQPAVFRTTSSSQPPPSLSEGAGGWPGKQPRRSSKCLSSERTSSKRMGSKGSFAQWYLHKDTHSSTPTSMLEGNTQSPGEAARAVAAHRAESKTGAMQRPQLGAACVEQEVCRVCGRKSPEDQWGNARCYGCSVVDMLSFKDHLFKPLTSDWPANTRPSRLVGHWPEKLPRSILTPPELGRSDALRQ